MYFMVQSQCIWKEADEGRTKMWGFILLEFNATLNNISVI